MKATLIFDLDETVINSSHRTPNDSEGANVIIPIPHFKGKDPQYYNFVYDTGKTALLESFTTLFRKNLTLEITALINGHTKRATLIYAFMEKHGIDEKHWDTVAQIYHRTTRRYFQQKGVKLK